MNAIDLALSLTAEEDFDLSVANMDLVLEYGLETAVIISLFSDLRVTEEELPFGDTDLRGWWGDVVDATNDPIGSKLWLLDRSKQTPETLAKAKEFSEQALSWMIRDGVAQSVTVTTLFPMNEAMLIAVEIQKPNGDLVNFEFSYAWAQQLEGAN